MAAGMMCLLLWLGFSRFDGVKSLAPKLLPVSDQSLGYRAKKRR